MSKKNRERGFDMFGACFGPKGFSFGSGSRGMRFRMFDRGDLKYMILRLLSEKPMHGYEVMRALEEESGGCYSASPGSVYPTLQMLEDQGYVVCEEKQGKKVTQWQSNPDVDPSMWFVDGDHLAWIVVRADRYPITLPQCGASGVQQPQADGEVLEPCRQAQAARELDGRLR